MFIKSKIKGVQYHLILTPLIPNSFDYSWERGQNVPLKGVLKRKNANGLLRQYFPKSMSLVDVTVSDVKIAVSKLNARPRKCLGFKIPY